MRFFQRLPKREDARILGRQLLRSGTSVAANYRAACRARSKPEFVAKLGVVVEEIDETVFWLELLVQANVVPQQNLADLLRESNELFAIFVRSQLTAKRINSSIRKSGNPSISEEDSNQA